MVTHKKAFDVYMRGVRELANAAGVMAHAEFEFLHSRVRTARQFLVENRGRLSDPHLSTIAKSPESLNDYRCFI